ncbi:MAG: DUF952 domain-containing protein [Paracoccaceae bacterium]
MLIFKILRAEEWADLVDNGATQGAPVDLSDGYVHFSTAGTVTETAAKYFADLDGLVILACDGDTMGDALKWEPSRGGALFPHLYRDLTMEDVLWSRPLPCVAGMHQFPEGIA